MRPLLDQRAFALDLDLGPVTAGLDEVRDEIGDRLDGYEPRLTYEAGRFSVSLTITAEDLWLAVLMAMAAVTATGYPVVRLAAQPVDDPSSRATAEPGGG